MGSRTIFDHLSGCIFYTTFLDPLPPAECEQIIGFFSATAAKRSRGDVSRRETVLSDDRRRRPSSKFFKF